MGILDKVLRRPKKVEGQGFSTFTEYQPVFTSYRGSIYEQELTRAAIERFAQACSKLKPEIKGRAKPRITTIIETAPNKFMTWSGFLSRLATILECDTTAYVVPVFDKDLRTIIGFYPMQCELAEVVEYKGEPWVRFTYATGETAALELKYVGILTKFQYMSDFFGDGNCLNNTMGLIHAQNEAQRAAIKSGASIRFIGELTGQVREEDIKDKRKRFAEDNLSTENDSGIILYDTTFNNVRQIEPKNYTMNKAEMELIQDNVFTYFAINKHILQNDFDEDKWGAWYEGKIEPFALRLAETLNMMVFTERERKAGNEISFSSNRLEYASNASKRNMISDMLDRGVLTINQALEILQLPSIGEEGDIRVIRGEYINAGDISSPVRGKYDADTETHDLTKITSDQYGQIDANDGETGV